MFRNRPTNFILTFLITISFTVATHSLPMKEQPCIGPEYSQMDFWIGTWELRWGGSDKVRGRNIVSKKLNECVVEENFTGLEQHPLKGQSVSVYDKTIGMWRQTWVDNTGSYLDFTGGPVDEIFIFSRTSGSGDKRVEQRMTFYNIQENSLDWDWEISNDGGLTWKLKWRIHYTRVEE